MPAPQLPSLLPSLPASLALLGSWAESCAESVRLASERAVACSGDGSVALVHTRIWHKLVPDLFSTKQAQSLLPGVLFPKKVEKQTILGRHL